jgi:hypothetical protein
MMAWKREQELPLKAAWLKARWELRQNNNKLRLGPPGLIMAGGYSEKTVIKSSRIS